jgi:hypothetical protein
MTSPLIPLLHDLYSLFERNNIRWYIFGAQAAIIHGASRMTADVDVTVIYNDHPLETLINSLKSGGFDIRVADPEEFIERTGVLPALHIETGMPVDIVFGRSDLEKEFERRACQYDIEGVKVPAASAEDVVTMKILAGREKDLEDAMAIISAQHEIIDMPYIKKTLGVLEKALDQRDLLPLLDNLIHRANLQGKH